MLCGWTSIGEIALEELLLEDNKIAVITDDKDDVTTIKRKGNRKNLFPIYGDPSKAEILEQAGIDRASIVILSMDDDSKNLITALHIKDRNPSARLIVKTNRSELKETMEIAGITFVTTPHELSGRLVASAAFEPDVANLIDDITTATNIGGCDLREYVLSKKGTVKNLSRELKEKTNTTLLAVAKQSKKDDNWKLHPNPNQDMIVNSGDTIVLLGNEKEFDSVEKILGKTQGR
ncbi:MAG: potassium channel family protein [Thermoplasmatota archaeon]